MEGHPEHSGWSRRSSVTCEDTEAFSIHIHLLFTTQQMEDVTGEKLQRQKLAKINFSFIKLTMEAKS